MVQGTFTTLPDLLVLVSLKSDRKTITIGGDKMKSSSEERMEVTFGAGTFTEPTDVELTVGL